MTRLRLVQLPVPQPAALGATGNVPLAAGCLAVSAEVHGLRAEGLRLEVVAPELTDRLGDTLLADYVARDEPDFVGLSLYLWNVERSLHLAREVKKRSPRTRVLIGGPEVSADNPFVLSQRGFDLAVTGEAEDTFAELMQRLLAGHEPRGMAGVAVRTPLGLSPFGPAPSANFALSAYPSPYLSGLLDVDGERPTYVETVRGCRSHCTYCFYPRSSNVLRVLDVARSAAVVASLRERGARHVTFLDPTFNHRPELEALLAALADVNHDRAFSCFGEVRAEGLTSAHAKALARAGFTRLEIGLQSVNVDTLRRIKRYGSPDKVAAAAHMLQGEGIEVVVDLIIGLPGDDADDVARGVAFLHDAGLGEHAQVFPLSLLPGTALRASAEVDGVIFDPAPPYRVRCTRELSEEALVESLFAAEDALGRRLDEEPRPLLVAEAEAPCDVFRCELERPEPLRGLRAPGAAHVALWLCGDDLFAQRERISQAIALRLAVDPYAMLDVVLAPRAPFPLDLLDLIHAQLTRGTASYASRCPARS
jgi:tRNA A37 methylthiotransferase MiaB